MKADSKSNLSLVSQRDSHSISRQQLQFLREDLNNCWTTNT